MLILCLDFQLVVTYIHEFLLDSANPTYYKKFIIVYHLYKISNWNVWECITKRTCIKYIICLCYIPLYTCMYNME